RPYWKISTDPQHPNVGFNATFDTHALPPGTHWLGLRLHGHDGSACVSKVALKPTLGCCGSVEIFQYGR
ncbi:hypothetical protein XarbCFBP8150_21615, partial [Xanthomonas arboricola]|uniref:hypothetical protein n=1 Tax=Xanthomonas arboricola TaxID=56448 RepID=UPI000D43A039